MPALAPWVGALVTVAACYSLGSWFLVRLRISLRRAELPPLAFTLGAALLHLIVFAILALHIAYTGVVIAIPIAVAAAGVWSGDWRVPKAAEPPPRRSWFARAVGWILFAIAGTFTVVYIFNAWAPEISPDGSSYHLALVARYLRAHGFQAVPTNMYSTLSQGVELIFLPAYAIASLLGGDGAASGGSAAAMVHLAFLIALGLAIRAYANRMGHALAGDAAALLVYLSPVAGVVGTSAYVDVGAAAAVFAAFYWTQLWDEDRRTQFLVCIGLMAGYAYAAKYTAALIAVYAGGFVLWRSRSVRAVALVAACAAMMAAPWLAKNWIYVHNPVAPFANRWFHNPDLHPEFERTWTEFLRIYNVKDPSTIPWMVFVSGGAMQNPLGPVFLFFPLGLIALRKKAGRRVLLPAVILLLTYPANIATRFMLPELPFVSFAIALALEELPVAVAALLLLHAAYAWPRNLRSFVAPESWVLRRTPTRAALRSQSAENYLSSAPNYRAARMIERVVPPGEKVLAMSGVADAYTSREILVSYAGALNEQLTDTLASGWDEIVRPSRAQVLRFPERALRRIRVVQTAAMPKADELWSVAELRVFRGGREVPRAAEWRLRAFPNPWDVGYAFDNSEATRWRSWQTAAPGMYIEIDFGAEVRADEIRIESAADNPDVRLQLQEADADGNWKPIDVKLEEYTVTPETSLRKAAAHELQAHGVRYLFLHDPNPGAEYYAADPESWNFTPVARADGATIYKIGP